MLLATTLSKCGNFRWSMNSMNRGTHELAAIIWPFKVLLAGRDELSAIITPSRVETCDAVKVSFTGDIEDKIFLT